MVTLNECKRLLSSYFKEKAVHYGVKRMGIFGSVARNEQNRDSDVDIVYEGAPNLLLRSKMKIELEALFGCTVDIVRLRGSNKEFEQEIASDIIYV